MMLNLWSNKANQIRDCRQDILPAGRPAMTAMERDDCLGNLMQPIFMTLEYSATASGWTSLLSSSADNSELLSLSCATRDNKQNLKILKNTYYFVTILAVEYWA